MPVRAVVVAVVFFVGAVVVAVVFLAGAVVVAVVFFVGAVVVAVVFLAGARGRRGRGRRGRGRRGHVRGLGVVGGVGVQVGHLAGRHHAQAVARRGDHPVGGLEGGQLLVQLLGSLLLAGDAGVQVVEPRLALHDQRLEDDHAEDRGEQRDRGQHADAPELVAVAQRVGQAAEAPAGCLGRDGPAWGGGAAGPAPGVGAVVRAVASARAGLTTGPR